MKTEDTLLFELCTDRDLMDKAGTMTKDPGNDKVTDVPS